MTSKSQIKYASEAQRGDENEVFIDSIKPREILDSKGMPTVEVELITRAKRRVEKNECSSSTDFGVFQASVPSGVSTGKYEAMELRDEDGKGVSRAIANVEKIIAPALEKEDLTDQKRIDKILIKLDGTKNKSRLGANAILPVSIAICRAAAKVKNLSLYQYIARLAENRSPLIMPKPSFNMIEGGKHSDSGLAFQEFMIMPQKEKFRENLEIGLAIYKKLKQILEEKYGKENITLSKEGAFSPKIKEITEAFDLILAAAEETGFKNNIKFAIDAAASSFFENGKYKINSEFLDKEKLIEFYQDIIQKYPIISLEDPFQEEDFEGFAKLHKMIGDRAVILGDDLLASNTERIKIAEEKKAANCLILKPNQIGTVTETIEAAKLAKSYGWKIMVSNRAGETEDDFIADLAVGIGAEFIKSGAPFPKERMAKYNRLVKIEEELVARQ